MAELNVIRYIYNIGTRTVLLLALSCQAGCTATDSDDPQPHPANGRVAVELALCVSTAQSDSQITRQGADVVQENNAFRGITDVQLIPFDVLRDITITDEPISEPIGGFSQQVSSTNYLTTGVELMIGTASFLGYAKASPLNEEVEEDNADYKFKYGKLLPCDSYTRKSYETPSDITFQLEQISTAARADEKAIALAAYLTDVAHAEGWSTTNTTALKNLFEDFTAEGVRAGASANVEAMLSQLCKRLSETAWTGADANVVQHIKEVITAKAVISVDGEVTLKDNGIKGYPANISLPDGSASIRWNKYLTAKEGGAEGEMEEDFSQSKFEALTKSENGENMSDQTRYVYPAELYYYTNSRIKTSKDSKASSYSLTTWLDEDGDDGVLNHYESDNAVVASTTRSVALKEQLNYGVSRLDLTIKAAATEDVVGYYLADNAGSKVYLTAHDSPLTDFPLTGVFVGGQYTVDFKFETGDGTTDEDLEGERIIYDRDVTSGIYLTNNQSSANYTLVLQSKLHKPVNIVLEFLNNSGKEFKGSGGGVISPGTHFYLSGKAIPSVNSTDLIERQRVFTRDHRTELTVTVKSLVNAYNVIPDLKTAQHELEITSVAVRQWNDISGTDKNLFNW